MTICSLLTTLTPLCASYGGWMVKRSILLKLLMKLSIPLHRLYVRSEYWKVYVKVFCFLQHIHSFQNGLPYLNVQHSEHIVTPVHNSVQLSCCQSVDFLPHLPWDGHQYFTFPEWLVAFGR